jgi:transposase-like protein
MATMNDTARPTTQETDNLDWLLGDITGGGRGAPRPKPEVAARAQRRRFTAEYKLKVLAQADAAKGSGDIGALLRREGLYSSHLTHWRQERKTGILKGLTPQKRGPKAKIDPVSTENQKLRRDVERLTEQLRKAEIVIHVQKKVAALLGRALPETEML